MKRPSLAALTLAGLLCLGVACSETDRGTPAEGTQNTGMEPDPNAPMGTPDETGETNPVVDENAGGNTTPPRNVGGQQAGGMPTWIVYTIPG